MAADEGGGKPRGEAEQAGDADDLDALAGGLGSIGPSEGVDEAEDETHDLAALGALAARTTLASSDPEDASLRLSTTDPNPAAAPDSPPARSAADQPVRAPAASATQVPGTTASAAAIPDATPPDAETRAALAAALTAPAMPPRARASWVMPLLVGIGVGVGIAGVMYGLSQRDDPQHPDNAPTAVPADPPSAVPIAQAPAPAVAAVVPATPVAPVTAPGEPAAARPASSAPRASAAPRAQASAFAASAEESPPRAPVLAVQPATAAPEDPELEAVAEAADKPASTMDALLDEALSPKARRDELAARQQAALEANAIPATPSREEVTQAMTVLLPAIRGCAMGQSGLATAGIVVHSDGRVASVEVAGAPFAGSASGRCMEGVIRRARFPHFSQPSFRIKFPLAIQ